MPTDEMRALRETGIRVIGLLAGVIGADCAKPESA